MDKCQGTQRLNHPSAKKDGEDPTMEALLVVTRALEDVMALYGRTRLQPYLYEHATWRAARDALQHGHRVLSRNSG